MGAIHFLLTPKVIMNMVFSYYTGKSLWQRSPLVAHAGLSSAHIEDHHSGCYHANYYCRDLRGVYYKSRTSGFTSK